MKSASTLSFLRTLTRSRDVQIIRIQKLKAELVEANRNLRDTEEHLDAILKREAMKNSISIVNTSTGEIHEAIQRPRYFSPEYSAEHQVWWDEALKSALEGFPSNVPDENIYKAYVQSHRWGHHGDNEYEFCPECDYNRRGSNS